LNHFALLSLFVIMKGGSASDGLIRVLDRRPSSLHERLPFFAGSTQDIAELLSYGDVQQQGNKKYEA